MFKHFLVSSSNNSATNLAEKFLLEQLPERVALIFSESNIPLDGTVGRLNICGVVATVSKCTQVGVG